MFERKDRAGVRNYVSFSDLMLTPATTDACFSHVNALTAQLLFCRKGDSLCDPCSEQLHLYLQFTLDLSWSTCARQQCSRERFCRWVTVEVPRGRFTQRNVCAEISLLNSSVRNIAGSCSACFEMEITVTCRETDCGGFCCEWNDCITDGMAHDCGMCICRQNSAVRLYGSAEERVILPYSQDSRNGGSYYGDVLSQGHIGGRFGQVGHTRGCLCTKGGKTDDV